MHAEHPVGALVGQDFHEAFGLAAAPGAAVGLEREAPDGVVDARLLQRFFRAAHRRRLGPCIDHAWNRIIVDMAGLAGDDLRADGAFVLRLVRQHRPAHDIANGVYALCARAEMLVDFDPALGVRLNTDAFEAEAARVGPAPDRDQHRIRLDRSRFPRGKALDRKRHTRLARLHARHLVAEHEGKALFREDAAHPLGNIAVHVRKNAVQKLDHRHLRAEPAPDDGHFQPDIAAADDGEALRHRLQRKRAGRGEDALLVDPDARQARRLGPRGDDYVAGLQHAGFPVFGRDLDAAGPGDASHAGNMLHLVLAEQEADAFRKVLHYLVLAGHHRRQIDLDAAGGHDAALRKTLLRLLEKMRAVQQFLRGNAADIQAGAAERRAFLDAGGAHAELRRPDRGHIAARPAADDDDIEAVGHGVPRSLTKVRRRAAGARDSRSLP